MRLGNPCQKQTIGLLQRRHIKIELIKCIGKESNSLETVDEGLEHSASNVYSHCEILLSHTRDTDSSC
jgi:hypothetical protein